MKQGATPGEFVFPFFEREKRGRESGSTERRKEILKKLTFFFTSKILSPLFFSPQADKGSAGVEMNQCNAEISFNKFAYGKSEKGGGLYLQGVGKFFLFLSFFFLFETKSWKKKKLTFFPPFLRTKKTQSETSRAASSRTTPPPSAAASSAAPPRETSSTPLLKETAPSRSAEASMIRTCPETSPGASSRAIGPRAGRRCSGPSPRGTQGTTRALTTRLRSSTTLPFEKKFLFFFF